MGGQRGIYCVERVNALCARDFKGVGNQFVAEGKLIVEVIDGVRLDKQGER